MAEAKQRSQAESTVPCREKSARNRTSKATEAKKAVQPSAAGVESVKAARRKAAAAPADLKPPAKRYLKARAVCRVTFRLPAEAVLGECSVHLTGDFNGWAGDTTPMDRLKNGDYGVTVDLEAGREYRFRYLIDGCRWENDWAADRYDPNPHGGFDSVIVV